MPDRLALYPQEARGAAIERAILDLEATAWDRTPGETFPPAPETHAASFVLLEGERAVCHVGIRRARLLHRGQGADLSLFTCAPERAALYGRAGWEPIPGACLVGGTRGGFCARGHRSGAGERTALVKKRAPALPILWKRGGALDFGGERGDYASANSWGAEPQSAWSASPLRFSAQRMA